MNLTLNTLLATEGIDPATTLVMRHRPFERALNRVIPMIAVSQPELFRAYQAAQSRNVEKALVKAQHVAAFIGTRPGEADFVTLFSVHGYRAITYDQYWSIPENQALAELGYKGWTPDYDVATTLWFDLAEDPGLAGFRQRVSIGWTGLERSYYRWANRNEFPIIEITRESSLEPDMPHWRDLVMTWAELRAISGGWSDRLREWRGVYAISDNASGRLYIGSAGGMDNILGRWLGYAVSGHGGNKKLRDCNPENLSFSILERVSPDMGQDELILRENTWKTRLHTRTHGLNEN